MNDLVQIKKGGAITNSLLFSEEFGFTHREVLEKIRNLTVDWATLKSEFTFGTFVNERGREYEFCEFGRNTYMLLIMQFGNVKSKTRRLYIQEKQLLFIEAFNRMEQMLLNQSNNEWVTAREQGKLVRATETDVIKKFVEYALASGSTGAAHYYEHFIYRDFNALRLLNDFSPKVCNTLDMLELHQLVLAEHIVTSVIADEMESGEHYKVIFEKCKNALEKFADSLYLKRVVAKVKDN